MHIKFYINIYVYFTVSGKINVEGFGRSIDNLREKGGKWARILKLRRVSNKL